MRKKAQATSEDGWVQPVQSEEGLLDYRDLVCLITVAAVSLEAGNQRTQEDFIET